MFLFLSPLTFFGLPLFLFLFLCLSVVIFFLPSFLSFFFAFFLFLVFVSFFPYLSSLLLFHEKKNIQIFNCNFFPEISSLSFGFLSCFSVSNPFLLSLLFPDFKLCFLFNINVFSFKKNKLKSTKKEKKQLQHNGFFYEPVFCKMWKVIVFFCPFFAKFWLMFKKHYKNRYFSKFLKAKNWKKKCILRCYYLGQVGVIIWAKLTAS